MANNGVMQRFKGRVSFPVGGLSIAGVAVNASAADFNTAIGWGSVGLSTTSTAAPVQLSSGRAAGVDLLEPVALTGGSIYRLPPPFAGAQKVIAYSTLNGSTVLFVTASTAGAVVFKGVGSTGSTATFAGASGSTLSNTFKSTQSVTVELLGLSTSQWLFNGCIPSTGGVLTWSTST